MSIVKSHSLLRGFICVAALLTSSLTMAESTTVRFATFNASFDRQQSGQLASEMRVADNPQIQRVAEIIQRVRPDVMLITEFDNDGHAQNPQAMRDFIGNYLAKSQNGAEPIDYPHFYLVPTNTGKLAKVDRNGDGQLSRPQDTYGFGMFHGQFAFAVVSKYPLDLAKARSFQSFLWKDMPNASLPDATPGSGKKDYFSQAVLEDFRLSSKNHLDLPVKLPGKTVHLLAMHPTPPVFDGPEDRNGRRNHDEIRLFADYIAADSQTGAYLVDDRGNRGGLGKGKSFVLMGDFNADPFDGDSFQASVNQLLEHPQVHQKVARGNLIPVSEGAKQMQPKGQFFGEPSHWTHVYPLRLDYVLPSADLNVVDSGVFWPKPGDKYRYLVEDEHGNQAKAVSSDHRLVWVDVTISSD
ncbi:endonuclease/exonuclease/phosphatase family protein [Paraferrimonas sedimenticola]|uniref:Succinyl-CoA synthetase subunit alpha n=1 Tax=Paraferrimonas sedimenticola TaxID=375674 RepID=A0AA37RVP1_9GAMM|nr:endonuclease/exonuclease/phosphatase family protein [Paraferrimonas sedimenticola]GLP96560.1 succinyl-CoA synthetase subunit alpha [Paraferrimonas sedimenticola]